MALRPLVAGNWKMHGLGASLSEIAGLLDLLSNPPAPQTDIMICPPATLLDRASEALSGSAVALGGQDCHPKPMGANTGDISAEMLPLLQPSSTMTA